MRIAIVLLAVIVLAVLAVDASQAKSRLVVEGDVLDEVTGELIPYATVRVEGTGNSTLTNQSGHYRLILAPGSYRLKFSHIAYYSGYHDVSATEGHEEFNIRLKSSLINVGEIRVTGRALDPGQRIIVEAIKRKNDILSRIHDYQFDSYVKLAVDDLSKDSAEIFLLTETQVSAFWEQPDKYKEIITARRQSANIDAENNLVTVGEILNFNRNRVDLGWYSVVSPTAKDALDHYNYYLLDTLLMDNKAIFRIEIEPKNPENPLFEGIIHIADSTYDVVQVDVGFSKGVEFSFLSDGRYTQKFARFQDEYWMPIEIRFSAVLTIDIPFPGIPNRLGITHAASLYRYGFETGLPGNRFDEFVVEVEREADDVDSVTWQSRQTIPLTLQETDAYVRIDSIESVPPPIGERISQVALGASFLLVFGEYDLFRFNRVEGAYLGLGLELDEIAPNLDLRLKSGYGFDSKRMQHNYGFTYRLEKTQRVDLSLDYTDQVVHRPVFVSSSSHNPSLGNLIDGSDPFDYHREAGFSFSLNSKLINHIELSLGYNDLLYYSLNKENNYSWFGRSGLRGNLPITEGKLRSWQTELRYDSRKMIRSKGNEVRIGAFEYTQLALGFEQADPDLFTNDYLFKRYYVWLHHRQRTLGMGLTSVYAFAGASDGGLPPQKYFTADFHSGFLFRDHVFTTMDENNFAGNRALTILGSHNFRKSLWKKSGIPGVKDIPLWLSLHGGVFWTEFDNHTAQPGDDLILTANKPFGEFGFGIGNLTPFMTPVNLAVRFVWQVSDYDTMDWNVLIGLEL